MTGLYLCVLIIVLYALVIFGPIALLTLAVKHHDWLVENAPRVVAVLDILLGTREVKQ